MLYQPGEDDCMKLWEYSGKRIKIITTSGHVFEGIAKDYTSELDNPDGVACISIGNVEFEENEIAHIMFSPVEMHIMAHAI